MNKKNANNHTNTYSERVYQALPLGVYAFALSFGTYLRFMGFLSERELTAPWTKAFSLQVFWLAACPLLLALLRSRPLRRMGYAVVFALLSLVAVVENLLIDMYALEYSMDLIASSLSTNSSETGEFFATAVDFSLYLPTLLYLLISLGLYFLSRRVFSWLREKSAFEGLVRQSAMAVYFLALMTGLLVAKEHILQSWLGFNMPAVSPWERLIHSVKETIAEKEGLDDSLAELKAQGNLLEGVRRKDKLPPHRFFLILGETTRADYMSCYGYPLGTTPRLDSLRQRGELFLFSDVMPPAIPTIRSVPNMMSLGAVDEGKPWYDAPLLPSIMKSAGYSSSWLSAQKPSKVYLNSIHHIAALTDSVLYIPEALLDEGLLLPHQASVERYKHASAQAYDFQVLHLMGSHLTYAKRYPKADFAKFTQGDVLSSDLSERKRQNIAHYLNSIYYNDYVVSELIKQNADVPAIVLYVTDHGEALYDDPNALGTAGHTISLGGVSVPMMIYLSPKMRELAPELSERIRSAQDKAFMTDLLPQSIMGLLGIESPDYRAEFDLFSEQYNASRKRIIKGHSLTYKK